LILGLDFHVRLILQDFGSQDAVRLSFTDSKAGYFGLFLIKAGHITNFAVELCFLVFVFK
jgi:hypothetical protein